MKKGNVLILGAYGHFGEYIARALVKDDIPIIIAGRHEKKAQALQQHLQQLNPKASIDVAAFDVFKDLESQLSKLHPSVVINLCGPYQGQDYSIAHSCISHHVHYIDLADAREFVNQFYQLNASAEKNAVTAICGASSVPGLSSAVIEAYQSEFFSMESLSYGINTGQVAPGGLGTLRSVLSYLGKNIKTYASQQKSSYGWCRLARFRFPSIGVRWMGNCDVPDLDLLPTKYGFQNIQFYGGIKNRLFTFSLWLLAWLLRLGLPLNLEKHAETIHRMAKHFDRLSSLESGMVMIVKGKDKNGHKKILKWYIEARQNHGINIPTVPAILLAKRLYKGELTKRGAFPCIGLINLKDYLGALHGYDIKTHCSIEDELP